MVRIKSCIKQPIVLLIDSGVGGLSIYIKIYQLLPDAYYLYFFDNAGFPYGEKSDQFIIDRIVSIIKVVSQRYQLDLVIIACSTATVVALSFLRAYFLFPVIGVFPAIKSATLLTRNSVIGLLATYVTIRHSYTFNLINKFARHCRVLLLGSTELVDMAEDKLCGGIVSISLLYEILKPWFKLKDFPDTIVLGCTHFTWLKKELRMVFSSSINLVDSCQVIALRAFWLIQNMMNFTDIQSSLQGNKVYCSLISSQMIKLKPVLLSYGFISLELISI